MPKVDRPTEEQVRELLCHADNGVGPRAALAMVKVALPALCHALLEAWERERVEQRRASIHEGACMLLRKELAQRLREADAAEKRADEMRQLLEQVLHNSYVDSVLAANIRAHLAAHPTDESEDPE